MSDLALSPGEIWGIDRGLEDYLISRIWTTFASTGGRIMKSFISSRSKAQRSPRFLARERAADSCPCSHNIVWQSITARWSVPLGIYAQFLWISVAKVIGVLWISSHLKFSPWEFSWMPLPHCPRTDKPLFGLSVILHDNVNPLPTRTGCQHFGAKWRDPPPQCVSRLEAGWCINIRDEIDLLSFRLSGPLDTGLMSSVKADMMPNDSASWLSPT
jgi:hypothetical protein